jgi:hypothetical protein
MSGSTAKACGTQETNAATEKTTGKTRAPASRAIRPPSGPAPSNIAALRVKFMVFKKFRISVIFHKWCGKVPGTS